MKAFHFLTALSLAALASAGASTGGGGTTSSVISSTASACAASSYAAAYSGNSAASSICASSYPQSYPSANAIGYYSTVSLITTSITCSPPGYTPPATTKPSSTASSSSVPVSALTKLPSSCFSSVCSSLAGTITTATDTVTVVYNKLVATSIAQAPEQCSTLDVCDKNSTKPVCRPAPLVNACDPGSGLSTYPSDPNFLPLSCTSTNGCSGKCYRVPAPIAKSASVTGNYSTNPDGFYFGTCVDLSPYVNNFQANNIAYSCQEDSDCGRGQLCGLLKYGYACIDAASETCNPGESVTLNKLS